MAELIENSGFIELTPEMLKTQEGVNLLNDIIRRLAKDLPSDSNNVRIFKGYGTPESAITADISSLYMRLDGSAGTTLYQKQSGTGNTGWVAVPGGTGSYSLTVEEQDGSPSVADVNKIKFPNGKVTDDGSGVVSVTVGDGDVVGPASAVDDQIATFDGTTGKLIQDSGYTISDILPGLELVSVTTFSAVTQCPNIVITPGESYRFIFLGTMSTTATPMMTFEGGSSHNYRRYYFGNSIDADSSGNVTFIYFYSTSTVTIIADLVPMHGLLTTSYNVFAKQMVGYNYVTVSGTRSDYYSSPVSFFWFKGSTGTISGTIYLYKYRSSL